MYVPTNSCSYLSKWGLRRVYLNNFIKIMFLEQHPNAHIPTNTGYKCPKNVHKIIQPLTASCTWLTEQLNQLHCMYIPTQVE